MDVKKARAILMKDGKIAIIKSERSGAYMLPGGKVEKDEEEIETVKREISEELGIEICDDDIEGPFFSRESECIGKAPNGKMEWKKTLTDFFIANTNQDFDEKKMHLTKKEISRGMAPEWINPSKLEYMLNLQKDTEKNIYFRKYAREYLRVYNEYKKYQLHKKEKEEEER